MELNALELAPRLIGTTLLVNGVGGIIVETEAYTRDDPASHSFKGPTRANSAMFGQPWHAYVYRSYGLHWCFNIVAAEHGAVLIRAIQPTANQAVMHLRRGTTSNVCNGPGRLCQSLGIDGRLSQYAISAPPFAWVDRARSPDITRGGRIGITKAAERPWRFALAGSAFLSRPMRDAVEYVASLQTPGAGTPCGARPLGPELGLKKHCFSGP